MRVWLGGLLVIAAPAVAACSGGAIAPSPQGASGAPVRFDYRASTTVSSELPTFTQACVNGVGRTHVHPSWRDFNRIDMQAVGTDLWRITFTDVPIGVRLSIRVSDPNVCAENSTGAATRNVSANDVRLVDVVPHAWYRHRARVGVHGSRRRRSDPLAFVTQPSRQLAARWRSRECAR